MWRKGNIFALLLGMQIDIATMEDGLKTLGIKPPCDPAIPLLGIYPEETKIEKKHMYPIIHCSAIYNT